MVISIIIVVDTRTNHPPDQRICFSSNTTQYAVANTTVRVSPSLSHEGDYCTNVSFTEEQACARNGTPNFQDRTVMHFHMAHVIGEAGAVEVNFTKINGELRVSFIIAYG